MEIHLIRCTIPKESPRLGVLLFSGIPRLVTLEPPDLGNKPDVSCIPVGQYTCKRFTSPKFNINTFKIHGIPDREDVIFHHGNTVKNTEGCILLGLSYADFSSIHGIGQSKAGVQKFLALTKSVDEFILTIETLPAI